MPNRHNKIIDKILPIRDPIVLAFNEQDAEIARNWQCPSKSKPLIDPLPLPLPLPLPI